MQAFGIPGMAIALVEAGEQPLARGYGVRRLGAPERVDEHTLFPIASHTKAFTATSLAILADEHRLDWDDRIVDRLPGFSLYDAYASHEMNVVDVLTHRGGMGAGTGDLLFWPGTTLSRDEIVHRLRYVKPNGSFRASYAYNNSMYVVAGRVVEAVSGQSWEAFVQQRIFEPLRMRDTVPNFAAVKTENRAWPHARLKGVMRGFGPLEPLSDPPPLNNSAPAGAINSSAADITKWLQVHLDRGAYPGGRLFSEQAAAALWTPRVTIPIDARPAPIALTQPQFLGYALGFIVRDYRGHRVITHTGWVEGGLSVSFYVPERKVAFMVMVNAEEAEAHDAIAYRLLDHYLGFEPLDWIGGFQQVRRERLEKAAGKLAERDRMAAQAPAGGPSLPLDRYAGQYRDVWYGGVSITMQPGKGRSKGGLYVRFENTPGMEGPLEPVRQETFQTRFVKARIENAYLTFSHAPDGSIDGIRVQAVSPTAIGVYDFRDLLLKPTGAH